MRPGGRAVQEGDVQDQLIFVISPPRAGSTLTLSLRMLRYERIDELVWIKTNQLQGLIRTGAPLLSPLRRTLPRR